jgi:squalene-hopene/tetraprenyl-beta-curcumene cyclase
MALAKKYWGVLLVALLCFISAGRADPRNDQLWSGGWDREGAATYLDERMDVWFANGRKLQTGQAQTVCVSCHTTVPYVMARPALRRAMQVNTATPQEVRVLEETTRRVEHDDALQPLFDDKERKRTESRGTEAVLNALILASADAAQSRREPSGPTQRALARMWETQRTDGAWDWLDYGLEPFESADAAYYGATLAALAIGVTPGSSNHLTAETAVGIERLRGYLRATYASQSLFNRVWLLLASTQLNDLLTRAEREALITEIQGRQHDNGGWALESLGPWRWSQTAAPSFVHDVLQQSLQLLFGQFLPVDLRQPRFRAPGTLDASLLAQADGYATGLIVYTLRQAGFPASHPAVSKGLQWLKANQRNVQVNQQAWPAWRAYSLNFDREHDGEKGEPWRRLFMSDSATAFAVLALVTSD